MSKHAQSNFELRQTVTLEFPLYSEIRILQPENVILKIAGKYYDIGAACYAIRAAGARQSRQAQQVVLNSFLKYRPKQILQIINSLSSLVTDGGSALCTTGQYAWIFLAFVKWADDNGLSNCLAGGDATHHAFRMWAGYMFERFQRQEIGARSYKYRLDNLCQLLQLATGHEQLMQGVKKVNVAGTSSGTEPLAIHDFAHAVALNQAIFDGLCDLVLNRRPFPFKLELPNSLGWEENHLWLFPTNRWCWPPHFRKERDSLKRSRAGPYDYDKGRIATIDEIASRYMAPSETAKRVAARVAIRDASNRMSEANSDPYNVWRFILGMVAQQALLFLFFCNTGGNSQVVYDLETDGDIDVSVQNQKFRCLKWRASGKSVELVAPATFMPRLRRFMELRKYLLKDRWTPYLFFSCGNRNNKSPSKTGTNAFENFYRQLLLDIDPSLPKLGARKLRASVDDYYLRLHDAEVAAAVMGHTFETELRKYGRGSAVDHHEEMTVFMTEVSKSAIRQRVINSKNSVVDSRPLENGGQCNRFGQPEPISRNPPSQPNCKEAQGCLFCVHRTLIAGEEDTRKIASAAYVMEQLVIGPKHEEAFRPLIIQCDEDLEKIAEFPGCRAMVEAVRKDVYENENLTPYWADKYQLFLELGILS